MHTMIFRTNHLTPEDLADLREYVATMPTVALLTAEQEASADANTLVVHNIRLSIIAACKYANRGVPVVDLVQEGNMGLMRAAETFDASKGRFSTYAMQPIVQYIKRAIHNQAHMISRPVWAQDGSKRPDIRPEVRELAQAREVDSLDQVVANTYTGRGMARQERTMADYMPPDAANTADEAIERVMVGERRTLADELLAVLPACERQAVELVVLCGKSYRDAAREIGGVSHEQVRRLVIKAASRMREARPEAIHAL